VEVRPSGASAVIVQRVRPADADWFLEWQRGVSAVAETVAGYRATDVYPPADGQQSEWVIVIHFDNAGSLQAWLNSSVRAQWVEKLRARAGEFEVREMPAGFGAWFSEHAQPANAPPSWKIVVTVVLGLFPTVMLLAVFPGPYTAALGFAASMLIGNFLSVSILQWAVSPLLDRVLRPWLKANSANDRAFSISGFVVILFVLAALVLVFRLLGIGER
jgi:antibiotic biosynthesis monooxygenase (ABM) superfamily enzyme